MKFFKILFTLFFIQASFAQQSINTQSFGEIPFYKSPVEKSEIIDLLPVNFSLLCNRYIPLDNYTGFFEVIYNGVTGYIYRTHVNYDSKYYSLMNSNYIPLPPSLVSNVEQEEKELKADLVSLIKELSFTGQLSENVITNVSSKLVQEKEADGKTHINLHVEYYYEVAKLSVDNKTDDFPAGGYKLELSNASMLTANFIKKSLEENLKKYLTKGRRVSVIITGSTDASAISSKINYKGEYGSFNDELFILNNKTSDITIKENDIIKENSQLAFLRACGLRNYIKNNISVLFNTKNTYEIRGEVNKSIGSKYRRIGVEIIVHDANESINDDLPKMYLRNKKAVFTIYTSTSDQQSFQGTGFFINNKGIAVSNYHVFQDANLAMIKADNGEIYEISEVIEANKELDYIIFKVSVPSEVKLGKVDICYLSNNIGEKVFAIGSPMGFEKTLSEGIISGFREDYRIIQTTAPINHGSSGGPLFNMKGEVIGITSGSFSQDGSGSLFYAININFLKLERFK